MGKCFEIERAVLAGAGCRVLSAGWQVTREGGAALEVPEEARGEEVGKIH